MKLSGKKLTTAILAGLMGATVAGISVVGAANLVILDGTTLKVSTIKGTKPIMNSVNVTKGVIDGTTEAGQGKIVIAGKTVGQNLTALDNAVAANKQETDKALATKADKADLEKAKVNTALHVDKDGKLVVGTDKKVNKAVSVEKGFKDGTTKAGQGKIVSADNTVGENLTALDTAVAANKQAADNALATKADKADLDKAKVDTALHVDKDGKLVVGTDKKVNKAVSVEKGFKDGTTKAGQGKIVSADNTVGENLTALDTAVAANKQAADNALATKADKADLDKAKVDTALHVDKDGKLVVGTDKKVNKAVSVEKGFKDGTTAAGQGKIVSADKTVGQNLTALDNAVATNQKAIDKNKTDIAANKTAIDKNTTNIGANTDAIHNEVRDRINAVADEAKARESGDNALQNQIKKESAARQADISRLDNKIHDVSKEVDTVGALSMAMSGLHPLSYDEGDARFQLSAAVGTYDGTEALALGGFYHFNRDSMLSVGVATDLGADEHRMGANVGYTRRIGQGGHVSRPSEGTVSDIMKDIKNLEQKQAKLEQENEQLKQQLAALKK